MRSGDLPLRRSSFVGRDRELRELEELLVRRRLVSLTGVGGGGKTALAVELARRIAHSFSGGSVFVDLSVVADADGLVQAVGRAVGVGRGGAIGLPTAVRPILADLRGAIADRALLLVLDNCEHLVDAVGDLVDRLQTACPLLVVLATSREPLGLEGEHVYRIPTLSVADAVRLFQERVSERPEVLAGAESEAAVGEICRRLDGIPLAIELAAARVAHLSPSEIAARLNDRLRFLGSVRHPPRHQTLEAAIDWSYALLTTPEQELLARLAVFRDGWTLAAAQTVCAATVDHLASLVDKSLVVAEHTGGATRYRFLETVRLYAEHRLVDTGLADALRDRHRDWFVSWAESFPYERTVFSFTAAATMEREHADLLAALEWSDQRGDLAMAGRLASRMGGFWWLHGHIEEASRWLAMVTAPTTGLAPRERAHCLSAMAFMALMRGEVTAADRPSAAAVEPSPAGEPAPALCLGMRGMYLLYADRARAVPVFDEAIRLAVAEGAEVTARMASALRAVVVLLEGDTATAIHALQAALTDVRWDDVRYDNWSSVQCLAVALHLAGRNEEAKQWALSLPDLADSAAWPGYQKAFALALAEGGLATHGAARRALRDAAEAIDRHHLVVVRGEAVVGYAALAAAEGDLSRASRLLACARAHSVGFTAPVEAVYRHYAAVVAAGLDPAAMLRARRLGAATTLEASIADELARPTPEPDEGQERRVVLRRESGYWVVAYAGTECRLPDLKGLGYLAELLRHPGQDLHVLDLVGVPDAVAGDAGPLLDDKARAAYRRRLSDLAQELEEAEGFHDIGRAASVRHEIDRLVEQLAGAVGLGGRSRVAASTAERARIAVTKAIRVAIARLDEVNPGLGEHFARTVRTGAFCSYSAEAPLTLA